jgi:uncharacterized membrane protein
MRLPVLASSGLAVVASGLLYFKQKYAIGMLMLQDGGGGDSDMALSWLKSGDLIEHGTKRSLGAQFMRLPVLASSGLAVVASGLLYFKQKYAIGI